jgi:hypothetical protein
MSAARSEASSARVAGTAAAAGSLGCVRLEESDELFYLCDECDALWPVEQFERDNYTAGLMDRSEAIEGARAARTRLRVLLNPCQARVPRVAPVRHASASWTGDA